MTIIRWILFIPFGLLAAILGSYAGLLGGKMFGDFISFTTSGCFGALAFIFVGFKVAPLKNLFVKNTLIVCTVVMGVLSGIGSLLGDDKLKCATGFSMALVALWFIVVSPAEFNKLVHGEASK